MLRGSFLLVVASSVVEPQRWLSRFAILIFPIPRGNEFSNFGQASVDHTPGYALIQGRIHESFEDIRFSDDEHLEMLRHQLLAMQRGHNLLEIFRVKARAFGIYDLASSYCSLQLRKCS
jgi:hypothetical protein